MKLIPLNYICSYCHEIDNWQRHLLLFLLFFSASNEVKKAYINITQDAG